MDFVVGVGQASKFDGEFVSWVKIGAHSLNGNERNVLLRNDGGETPEFLPVGYVAGVDRIEDSRGVGVLDIDLDGDLDLVVQGVEKPSILLVNQGAPGNYLEVRLRGTRSNRDGIGARIEVRLGSRSLMRGVRVASRVGPGSLWRGRFPLGGEAGRSAPWSNPYPGSVIRSPFPARARLQALPAPARASCSTVRRLSFRRGSQAT
jgi:hypothetical protein